MGGKASLFLVLGFSLIFMAAGNHFHRLSLETTDNAVSYYNQSKANYIANTGVNVVINKLFLDAAQADGTFTYDFDAGSCVVTLSTINAYQNIRQLLAVGNFNNTTKTIRIVLKPSLFSKYAYFSNSEGSNINWTTADTVWGPFHTNGDLRINGYPVFNGKVSVGGKEVKVSGKAKYLGGFQKGINIAIPTNGVTAVGSNAEASAVFTGKSLIYLDFRGDSIRYRFNTTSAWTYKLASTFAPNGVIYAQDAEVHIKGNVKGQYSLAVSGTSGSTGQIFIDDNIYYNTDPRTNPSSTDMLGLVAKRNVIITNNAANNSDVVIQASVYAETGSFTAQNHDSRPYAGIIDLYGGITQKTRGPVGIIGGGGISNGFSKRYRYDERLLVSYPPFFPGCGSFEVVSWLE